MILYFSGTGNSAYVAGRIGKALQEPLYNIGEAVKKRKRARAGIQERMIFVLPTYAWRIPRLVEEWISKSDFTAGHKVYFVMTCGSDTGNAAEYVKKLCKRKGFCYMGCAEIVMPENYIAMFSAPGREESEAIIKKAEPAIDQVIEEIKNNRPLREKPVNLADKVKSGAVNNLFYPAFVHDRKFYAKNTCIGCGKCVQVCPLGDIKLEGEKPVWGGKCTHCMACICGCPAEAIEYGRSSRGKVRYQCPYL